jgi:hypothetical protein
MYYGNVICDRAEVKNLMREAWCWWLTPVILATWEAKIRMIMFKASLG